MKRQDVGRKILFAQQLSDKELYPQHTKKVLKICKWENNTVKNWENTLNRQLIKEDTQIS